MNKINHIYHSLICLSLLTLMAFPISGQSAEKDSSACEANTLEDFFNCHGGSNSFTDHFVDAITAFIKTEDAISAENYALAKTYLDEIWTKYPIGNELWWNAIASQNGTNIGSPYTYYGLRMMDDILNYHINLKTNNEPEKLIKMNVVLPGSSEGIKPTSFQELITGTGPMTTNRLDEALLHSDYRIVRQSLSLFLEYITAITNGKLEVDLNFIELPDLSLPATVSSTKPFFASADIQPIWDVIPDSVKDSTDWWWILYPSNVPLGEVFHDQEFITGGMGLDPRGGPAFIIDDKWIVRKPYHLGSGTYTDIERRAYLPQWLDHEFFHHLCRLYPNLKLEVNGHDWFNRNFWPSDFNGIFEPDYYAESLHKRIQDACPPLSEQLITRADIIDKELFAEFTMDDFMHVYSQDNITNLWHQAEIIKVNDTYYWKNLAFVQWSLTPNFEEGRLETGADCPYPGNDFSIELGRNSKGEFTSTIEGLTFLGESYKRRSEMFQGSIPVEMVLDTYTKNSGGEDEMTGSIFRENNAFYWKNNNGESWALIPDFDKGTFESGDNSPNPGTEFTLVFAEENCRFEVVGFYYDNELFKNINYDGQMTVSRITEKSEEILIYPIPADEQINIRTAGKVIQDVAIYDGTGRQLSYIGKNISNDRATLTLNHEFSGMLILLIQIDHRRYSRKIFVK